MKDSRKAKLTAVALLAAALAAGCSGQPAGTEGADGEASSPSSPVQTGEGTAAAEVTTASLAEQVTFDEDDARTDWSEADATKISLSGSAATVDGAGAAADGGVVTISAAGTYVVSGSLDDGRIVVDAADSVVHLVLNGAQIQSSSGPAIYAKAADKTVVTLQDGTDNAISDGKTYADTSEEAPTAALYSQDDLTINGTGKLTVQGLYKDGITSKDDLKVMGGTLVVEAADDGLVGRDLVAVKDGSVTVQAGGDGIKSTNDTDADKGLIGIEGGTFDIASENDGIQAETSLLIAGGTFQIVTGGGSAASTKTHAEEGPFGQGRGGFRQGQAPAASPTASASVDDESSESTSAKALKAANIAISDGTFRIDAADDAIHGNGNVFITGGQFALATGDDAVHADAALTISGGTIDLSKSYEGLEGADITISGGETHLVASDDGVNVSGGSDAGGPGQGPGEPASGGTLAISGGYLVVDAGGDGLDSNGSAAMSGGTVLVNGPTNSGNGPLDYNGTFEQTGGVLIAAGSAGMAQAPSESSSQLAVQMTFPSALEAGTLVTLKDSSGQPIVTFAPAKTFQSIVISTPELKAGETYTFYTGGTSTGTAKDGLYEGGESEGGTKVVSFEMGDTVTYVNESGVTTGGSGMGGPGGFGGGRGGGMGRGWRGAPGGQAASPPGSEAQG